VSLTNIRVGAWNVQGGDPLSFGDQFYLVTAKTAADVYYSQLIAKGVADGSIFSSLSTAHDAMVTGRGDVLYVLPGSHNQATSLTWTKADTSIVGVMPHRSTYHAAGQPRIVCTTAAIASILNINAANVSMFNIGTYNAAANSGNLYDIIITKNNFYAEGCHFRGGNDTNQTTAALAGIPLTLAADGTAANGGYFKNCTIGSSGNAERTKGPGALYIPASSGGFGLTFEDCTFSMRSKGATGDFVSMIYMTGTYSIPRELLFKNCFFYNYAPTTPENLNVCVQDDVSTDHSIVFWNCGSRGIDAWGSNTNNVWVVSGSAPVAHGGIAVVGDIT
jgi:hypothetical protein